MWRSLYFHLRFSFPVETPKKNFNVQPRWETAGFNLEIGKNPLEGILGARPIKVLFRASSVW